MNILHIVLLAGSVGIAAVASASGGLRQRASRDGLNVQLVAYVVAGALTVGNAACLLPGTPLWYSAALVASTVSAVAWLLVSVVRVNRENARRAALATATRRAAARADLDDFAPLAPVVQLHQAARDVVTADDLHAVGPEGSRRAASSTVYVAANIGTYTGASPRRRGHVAALAPIRPHQSSVELAKVRRTYDQRPARASRIVSTL